MSGRYFKLLLILTMGAFLLVWHQAVGSQDITQNDESFDDPDWTSVRVEFSAGSIVGAEQSLDGGFPDAFRVVTHELPGPLTASFGRATSIHSYQPYSYLPVASGPLHSIDFRSHARTLSGYGGRMPSYFEMSLIQVGRPFRTNRHNLIGWSGGWAQSGSADLLEQDFWAVDWSCDQPDFSASGGLMKFGFAITQAQASRYWPVEPSNAVFLEFAVDNWGIDLWQGSPPEDPGNTAPVAVADTLVVNGFTGNGFLDLIENDNDPDSDTIELRSVSPARYGDTLSLDIPGTGWVRYRHLGDSEVDTFCYVLSDVGAAPKHTLGQVDVFLDCTCASNCLLPSVPTADKGDSLDLGLIYRVRDEMFAKGFTGQRLIDYYYESTPELIRLLVVDEPDLGIEAVNVAEQWSPLLGDYLDGPGDLMVTQQQVDGLDTFLDHLFSAASPDLKQLITGELNALGPLQDYVGKTSREAFTQALVIEWIFTDGFEDAAVFSKFR